MGFEPTTTHQAQALRNDQTPMRHICFLLNETYLNIFKFNILYGRKKEGVGAKPQPMVFLHHA
jgi:hypothetical protein